MSKEGTRLEEPPSIEGYLDRHKPGGQAKAQVYLATHNGNLFLLPAGKAFPPTPLGVKTPEAEQAENYSDWLRQSEVKRGTSQLLNATGVSDLRNILVVRRAWQQVPQATHNEHDQDQDDDSWVNVWSQPDERTQDDNEDQGGDEALSKHPDKPHLKMRRSFELLFKNGHLIRLEVCGTPSPRDAPGLHAQ
jgi:hypothetical protein